VHGVLDGPQERKRQRTELDREPEAQPGAGRRRVNAQPDRGQERVVRVADPVHGRTAAGQPLDAADRGLAEPDGDAELIGQRGLDDFLLDLAVERDG